MPQHFLIKGFRSFILAMLLLACSVTFVQAQKAAVPGTIPKQSQGRSMMANAALANGLQQIYATTGKYTLSADGKGFNTASSTIRVNKPSAAATVDKAILMSSLTFGSSNTIANGCVTIAGSPVTWNATAASPSFRSYWADVTSLVATQINALPTGISNLALTECNTGLVDGEALLVVFNDPAATEKTIVILFGALATTGDNFSLTLAQPINPATPGALLDMGLGIGFGFQSSAITNQFSQITVNGQRITSSAGGSDDGIDANGALITVGGIGDANTNPPNPLAPPTNARSDDELYSLLPFITSATTSLTVNTLNPSNDDNVFLAYFNISGAAVIGEGILLSQTNSSGSVGSQHTVKASVVNTNGLPVTNRPVTFTITTGPNAGNTSTVNTNASGEAFYTYTGSGGAGTDNIRACFTNSEGVQSCSNVLAFQWLAAATSNIYYSKPAGDLHNVLTWGLNPDGTGNSPLDFDDSTFQLANRPGVYSMTANWTVNGGTVNIPAANQLLINDFTFSISELAGAGTISGSGASNLIVTGVNGGNIALNFTAGSNTLNNFTINRAGAAAVAILGNPLNVVNELNVATGQLLTGGNLTLKSSASNTARVAPVTGSLSGDVIVERYIPARRAWRILSAPVMGSQTVQQGWQEGAVLGASATPNPFPGYGTHITGGLVLGTIANGFDQNPVAINNEVKSSLKRYNSATNTWVEVPNTNITAINSEAFMLFVRGDRGIPLSFRDVPPTNTTLRAKGALKVGDQNFVVNATGFTAIPNPYAAPINFASITRSGVQNNFYVWDPNLGGVNGVGGYVLFSFNGATYDVSPTPAGPVSQYIQSGQGFLVRPETSGIAGSITIKESDKSGTLAQNVFRTAANKNLQLEEATKNQGLRIGLLVREKDGSHARLDEVFNSYHAGYAAKIDHFDAVKLENVEENLGLVRDNQTFMIERKPVPSNEDVLNLKIWNIKPRSYALELNPVNLSSTGLKAYVEDRYLKSITELSMDRVSQINFTVTADLNSARADRFQLLLSRNTLRTGSTIDKSNITVYPNPIVGQRVQLSFSNKAQAVYQISIFNTSGQLLLRKTVNHAGGTAMHHLDLGPKLQDGVYRLQISGNNELANLSISTLK